MTTLNPLVIGNYTSSTSVATNYDSFGRTDQEVMRDEEDKKLSEYLKIQKASRLLYNRKAVRVRICPLQSQKHS